jgi:hypothetical protein
VKTFQARYVAQLKAETIRLRDEEAKAKRPLADPRLTENWKPLTDQITQIWLSLPSDLRARPVLIPELTPQLRGRYHARPSAGDVGQALRALKFTRTRDWRSGRRRWLPGPDTFR